MIFELINQILHTKISEVHNLTFFDCHLKKYCSEIENLNHITLRQIQRFKERRKIFKLWVVPANTLTFPLKALPIFHIEPKAPTFCMCLVFGKDENH